MIVGIGIDVVDLARFADLKERQSGFVDRILTPAEQVRADGSAQSLASLAARFAAKEALVKAMGGSAGLTWHDCQVLSTDSGAPRLHLTGAVSQAVAVMGAVRWHVSLSHDGEMASAIVILEGP